MVRVDQAWAVEVVIVGVDAEEGSGENDQALVALRAGERVRVVPAHSPGPEPGGSALIVDLQVLPVNSVTCHRSSLGKVPLTSVGLQHTVEAGPVSGGWRRC